MPTLGLVAGKDVFLYINQGNTKVLVGCASNSTFNISAEMLAAACKASGGWDESKPGKKSWEVSLEGVYKIYDTTEDATNYSGMELFDAIANGTELTIHFGTDLTGDTQLTGKAYVTSWEWTADVEGISTYSATLTGSGPVTKVVKA